jgi:hypothetical protein
MKKLILLFFLIPFLSCAQHGSLLGKPKSAIYNTYKIGIKRVKKISEVKNKTIVLEVYPDSGNDTVKYTFYTNKNGLITSCTVRYPWDGDWGRYAANYLSSVDALPIQGTGTFGVLGGSVIKNAYRVPSKNLEIDFKREEIEKVIAPATDTSLELVEVTDLPYFKMVFTIETY